MHGMVRNPTWTDINQTILPGSNTIVLASPVDWQIG